MPPTDAAPRSGAEGLEDIDLRCTTFGDVGQDGVEGGGMRHGDMGLEGGLVAILLEDDDLVAIGFDIGIEADVARLGPDILDQLFKQLRNFELRCSSNSAKAPPAHDPPLESFGERC